MSFMLGANLVAPDKPSSVKSIGVKFDTVGPPKLSAEYRGADDMYYAYGNRYPSNMTR